MSRNAAARTFVPAALALLALALIGTSPAAAHSQSTGFLSARFDGDTVSGRFDLAVRDLDRLADLDRDGDGRITWGEVRARETDLAARLLGAVAIGSAGETCRLEPGPLAVEDRAGEHHVTLPFTGTCPQIGRTVRAGYDLLFGLDAQHRGFVDVTRGEAAAAAVLTPSARSAELDLAGAGALSTVVDFVESGIHHIAIGLDHILFVVTLLLSVVLIRRDGRWYPAAGLGTTAWSAAKLVTAFTLAHSLTLSIAALGLVELPSALIESVIALSIVVAAINVVVPVVTERLWMLAFGFGLMHGFGFASVLADVGLPKGYTLLALFSFNLGVEVGQLAIVAVVLPVLYAIRSSPAYTRVALPAGCLAIAGLAAFWFLERSIGLEWPLAG